MIFDGLDVGELANNLPLQRLSPEASKQVDGQLEIIVSQLVDKPHPVTSARWPQPFPRFPFWLSLPPFHIPFPLLLTQRGRAATNEMRSEPLGGSAASRKT
jgi:hypothetical protein